MYCNGCGKSVAEDARFCAYCGNAVSFPAAAKRLMRPRADRKIAGVCAGLAQYLDIDVTLVRIFCLFITFATGVCPGVVTYLLAWILVPAEPQLSAAFTGQQPVTS